ncbi:OB-fold domain-containing protein [Candidatus Gottesmanbacteria bacterium]|nr:OB-fold domain-containing protein [Candidatus Gottesmanbacteria bacterium]
MFSPVKIWRNQKKIQKILGLTGKILSWTKIYVPPAGFESQAPYVVAVVEFEKGKKYLAQLVEWEEKHLIIGQKVKSILRRTKDPGIEGVIPYGVKFKPI